MAAPKKKPVVKKAPVKKTPKGKKPSFLRQDTPRPARDVKPGDLRSQASQGPKKTGVKSPAETRKSISRKQVGTTRPARGDLGARAQYLKYGPTQPQGPEAPTYREKIGPVKPNAADPKRPIFRREGGRLLMRKDAGSVLLKRSISKIPVVGTALGFIADAAPAGEGSTKDKYSTLKKKYSSDIGPKQPAGTKKSSGFGKRISEGAKFERLRASRAALATKSSSGTSEASSTTQNRPTTTRPKPMNTKAADYAAMQQGQAKVKSAATKPTPKSRPSQVVPSAPVKRGGLLSRTEREGLSTDRMQRKPKGNLLGFLKKRK